MLMKLLLSFEQMEANMVRKGKVNELLRENAFSDFRRLILYCRRIFQNNNFYKS